MTATKAQQKRLNLDALILASGGHYSPDSGLCVMEAVAFMAGEKHSDHPACACPVISAILRRWNDRAKDKDRQELKRYIIPLVGSKSTPAVENTRRWIAVDWAVRTALPFVLREAKLNEFAEPLEKLPEINSYATRHQAWPTITAARDAACAARRKSWKKWDELTIKQKVEVDAAGAAVAAVVEEPTVAAAMAGAAVAAVVKKKAEIIRAGLSASAHDLIERMLAVKE